MDSPDDAPTAQRTEALELMETSIACFKAVSTARRFWSGTWLIDAFACWIVPVLMIPAAVVVDPVEDERQRRKDELQRREQDEAAARAESEAADRTVQHQQVGRPFVDDHAAEWETREMAMITEAGKQAAYDDVRGFFRDIAEPDAVYKRVGAVADEAAKAPAERKTGIVKTLLSGLTQAAAGITSCASLA